MTKEIYLGNRLTLQECMDIVKRKRKVYFSKAYKERVSTAEQLLKRWIDEDRVIYGVTTGFGALSSKNIESDELERLQKNILLSHAVSVGQTLSEEAVRAIMICVLQNLGYGASGIRLSLLERYREILNSSYVPWAPANGSVGYLAVEAHIALPLLGYGYMLHDGDRITGQQALKEMGKAPFKLGPKEGLALISGTTSPTGLAVLGTWYAKQAFIAANYIAAMALEVVGGNGQAYAPELWKVRHRKTQESIATEIYDIICDSQLIGGGGRVQDALSIRCAPQLHGAATEALLTAERIVEDELNFCNDNPIVWTKGDGVIVSGGNPDSSYVGWAMDSLTIGMTMMAKISERRTNRLLDEKLSGKPAFLISNPGINSGLMITQYTQAGLLNEMRILAHPATIDNTPTCADQEDYVAMGYTAAYKSIQVVEKLEYILAIELLAIYQAYYFTDMTKMAKKTKLLFEFLADIVPQLNEDEYIYPYIEKIRQTIHDGTFIAVLQKKEIS